MSEQLRSFYADCLLAIDLGRVLPERVQIDARAIRSEGVTIEWGEFDEALVVVIGKASCSLAEFFAPRVPLPTRGVVVGPGSPELPASWVQFEGGHPTPDLDSFRAAEAIRRECDRVSERTLALCLLSGGGSAMVEQPLGSNITVRDCQCFNELLVHCGAPIESINVLRKHASAIKGGRMAELISPARQLTLYLSDVPSHCPSAIASGPTFPDESTVADCLAILDEYSLRERLPSSYRALFEAPVETPKTGDSCFDRSTFAKLLDNDDALASLAKSARAAGWVVEGLELPETETIEGAIDVQLTRLDRLGRDHPGRTVAIVSGGEVNCAIGDDAGIGGRNQALAIALAEQIDRSPIAFLAAGTDGIDGNSTAAGAVVDGQTASRARERGIDLADARTRFDSHTALDALGATIVTGPTGNNVRDVRMLVRVG